MELECQDLRVTRALQNYDLLPHPKTSTWEKPPQNVLRSVYGKKYLMPLYIWDHTRPSSVFSHPCFLSWRNYEGNSLRHSICLPLRYKHTPAPIRTTHPPLQCIQFSPFSLKRPYMPLHKHTHPPTHQSRWPKIVFFPNNIWKHSRNRITLRVIQHVLRRVLINSSSSLFLQLPSAHSTYLNIKASHSWVLSTKTITCLVRQASHLLDCSFNCSHIPSFILWKLLMWHRWLFPTAPLLILKTVTKNKPTRTEGITAHRWREECLMKIQTHANNTVSAIFYRPIMLKKCKSFRSHYYFHWNSDTSNSGLKRHVHGPLINLKDSSRNRFT